jgi:hypothetical protein
MFEFHATDDIVRIAAAGGGFTLDGASRSTEDLIAIAKAANSGQADIAFRGLAQRHIDDILSIAKAGGGFIKFV